MNKALKKFRSYKLDEMEEKRKRWAKENLIKGDQVHIYIGVDTISGNYETTGVIYQIKDNKALIFFTKADPKWYPLNQCYPTGRHVCFDS